MKVVTYNLNGIRSATTKGLLHWLPGIHADVVLLQEVRAKANQADIYSMEAMGYHVYWQSAEKSGNSGVAILSKIAAESVTYGCGNPIYDCEGRVLQAKIDGIDFVSVYMPSGTTGEVRQAFKMEWLAFFTHYATTLLAQNPNLIIAGDFNIAHTALDIKNAKGNAKNSGFLPEERDWFTQFLALGFTDTYRHFVTEGDNYTWWSARAGSRDRNVGWRIDYITTSEALLSRLSNVGIYTEARHSDHAASWLVLK